VKHLYNDLLKLGSVTVHGYGLAIGIGIICAVFLAEFRAKKRGLNADAIFSMALLALIFGFVGAKLLYGVTDLQNVLSNPLLLLTGDGFVVYGGILGGIVAAMIYCRVKKLRFLTYFDLLIPSVALAQGFGRIGCFLAGCCFGRETSCFFGITFTNSLYAPNGVKLIPTQLLSSAGDFLIAAALLFYARKDRKKGQVGGLYLILYSVGRFLIEFFRGDIIRGFIGPLSTSQFVSIFSLVLGILLFCTTIFGREKSDTKVDSVEKQPEADNESKNHQE
jgi:phosphatidylglycerol:prolipoprotein diacylglycerol transferase